MLKERPMTYTEVLNELGIENGLLNYHLENLVELLAKGEDDKYRLSEFGEAGLSLIERVEEPVNSQVSSGTLEKLRIWQPIIIGFLILSITLTSFLMVGTEGKLVEGYSSRDYGNSWYPPNTLYGFEMWQDHPETIMNFWWDMNSMVDVYLMTREQYISQKDYSVPPDNYLRHYVGKEGNVTILVERRDINYEFTMFTGEYGTWEEGHGFAVYRWKQLRVIDRNLLVLDFLLVLITSILLVVNNLQ
jgi:hypothetical protein